MNALDFKILVYKVIYFRDLLGSQSLNLKVLISLLLQNYSYTYIYKIYFEYILNSIKDFMILFYQTKATRYQYRKKHVK